MKTEEAASVLTCFNQWRRGDDYLAEAPSPAEIGEAIDVAVMALHENVRLRESLESLAYYSRNRQATREELRDRIAAVIASLPANRGHRNKRCERIETALRDAISTYMGADKLVTAERIEAWQAALRET